MRHTSCATINFLATYARHLETAPMGLGVGTAHCDLPMDDLDPHQSRSSSVTSLSLNDPVPRLSLAASPSILSKTPSSRPSTPFISLPTPSRRLLSDEDLPLLILRLSCRSFAPSCGPAPSSGDARALAPDRDPSSPRERIRGAVGMGEVNSASAG
eukprot:scaffold21361_cov27-Tisochrysis_lutea.AAC.3